MLVELAFFFSIAAAILLDVTLLATLAAARLQIWPPPGRDTWQYRLTWTLFTLSFVGFLVVGGLDVGSLGLHRWIGEAGSLIVGSTLFMGGTAIASYAMGYIGHRAALGLEAELVTDGPYALSRNPGYVGDIVLMAGYVVLTDSRFAALVAVAGAVWFLLAPFAEEPWLERQHGEVYQRYRTRVPRWMSIRRRNSPSA